MEPYPISGTEANAQRPAVLVVDDEPEIAGIVAEVLATDGCQVETAGNGRIALEKLRANAYDLIVSDIRMPELDGIALYRAVEQQYPSLRSRFIFISGNLITQAGEELLARTGAPLLRKPFDLREFRRLAHHALGTP
jgi:two-component system NtrC family sensor kinase